MECCPMMQKINSTVIAMFLGVAAVGLTVSSAQAADLIVVSGQLTGAKNVDVHGTLYDVTFLDGSCIDLFSGCDGPEDFVFSDQADAEAAAVALLDQVLVDGVLGMFDSATSLTLGCTNTTICETLIPVAFSGPDRFLLGSSLNFASGIGVDEARFGSHFRVTDFSGISNQNLARFTLAGPKEVAIDIKPGSFPNSINLGSGGATPVAILGSDTFDVLDVDTSTLTLGTSGVKTVGKKDHQLCSIEDVSGDFDSAFGLEGVPDGFDDLVCHFITVDIVPEAGDTDANISGELMDGTPFEGSDSVIIVP